VRGLGRLVGAIIFLLFAMLSLQRHQIWEAAYQAGDSGWLWPYVSANGLLIAGVLILELPRILTSRGRLVPDWSGLIIYGLPGLALILYPFWSSQTASLAWLKDYLGEVRILGDVLLGLGLGKTIRFLSYDYYRYRHG
jgi:hypothetical protein